MSHTPKNSHEPAVVIGSHGRPRQDVSADSETIQVEDIANRSCIKVHRRRESVPRLGIDLSIRTSSVRCRRYSVHSASAHQGEVVRVIPRKHQKLRWAYSLRMTMACSGSCSLLIQTSRRGFRRQIGGPGFEPRFNERWLCSGNVD